MAMVARFRVATRATGIRRQIWVHVYDDQQQLMRAHAGSRGKAYDPEQNILGAVSYASGGGGWKWPTPDPGPVIIMRLWTEDLTTNTIAHESTHAAAVFYFADSIPGWDSRARTHLLGNHEPLAYLVGDFTAEVVRRLYRARLLLK